jgi:hypothetical protein
LCLPARGFGKRVQFGQMQGPPLKHKKVKIYLFNKR